jgi:hypothetical protein
MIQVQIQVHDVSASVQMCIASGWRRRECSLVGGGMQQALAAAVQRTSVAAAHCVEQKCGQVCFCNAWSLLLRVATVGGCLQDEVLLKFHKRHHTWQLRVACLLLAAVCCCC